MSKRRKMAIARFQVTIDDYSDGEYLVSVEELSWTVTIASDGQPEITSAPEASDLPPRLTDQVILAAVAKFPKLYRYNV